MPRTIIIEGPPGSGASELAKRLVEEKNYEVRFVSPDEKIIRSSEEKSLHFFLGQLVRAEKRRVVFLGFHLDPKVRRFLTPRVEDLLARYLEARDAVVVVALPPWREVVNAWVRNRKAETIRTAKELRNTYRAYARCVFNQYPRVVHYDYTRLRASSFARNLVETEGYPLPAGMVGSQRPRFVFVGEKSADPVDLPFLSTRGSSGWLYDALADAGFRENEIAFANALRYDGRETDLAELVAWFHPRLPEIVTLGGVAEKLVARLGVAFHPFEHPQYVKRFKASERERYVAALAHVRRSVA